MDTESTMAKWKIRILQVEAELAKICPRSVQPKRFFHVIWCSQGALWLAKCKAFPTNATTGHYSRWLHLCFEYSVPVQVYVLEKAGVSITRLFNVVVSLILALGYDISTGDAQWVFNRSFKVVVSSMFLLIIRSATCLWNPGSWIMPECVWQFHLSEFDAVGTL
jgi:hypothetical protein